MYISLKFNFFLFLIIIVLRLSLNVLMFFIVSCLYIFWLWDEWVKFEFMLILFKGDKIELNVIKVWNKRLIVKEYWLFMKMVEV